MKRLSTKIHSELMKSLLIAGFSIGLLACNPSAVKNSADEPEPANQKEWVTGDDIADGTQAVGVVINPASDAASQKALDEALLFNLLAGEFAGVRGDMQQSIRFYAKAAELSDDSKLIARAAYIALYAGQFEQAIELTDQWLALKLPMEKTIERIRIIAFLHLQRLEPIVDMLEAMLTDAGKLNHKSVASITQLLTKEASPQFARQVVQFLNIRKPGDPFILLLLAKFEANLGEYETALEHVDQLIEIDENIADAYLIRAQIYAGMKQDTLAIESIATAIEKRPKDVRLRLQYGRMLVQMKMFEKALLHFKVLQKSMPHDENVLLSLGLLSIEIDNNPQAKKYLQELLDNGYHNQQAHYYLGRIQQNDGEVMAAIANYDQVLNGGYWLDARLRAAGLLAVSGQPDAAIKRLEVLNRHEQTDKARIQIYLAKGEVLRLVSRHKEAYELYNNALSQSPENTDLLYARALTAEKLDMLDVAESDLKMVIMHEPENASALNALGYTLADRTERYNEAQKYILKAAQLLPDDPAILDSLGWVHYRLGQYKDAIKWLSKAFETLQDAEIAAHLGAALWMDGQIQKANNIWMQGKKLDGNQTMLRDTIDRLKK